MIATDSSPPSDSCDRILCYYVNQTVQLQRVCLANDLVESFDRMIFPKERFLFAASPDAVLEIHSHDQPIVETISCLQLKVTERDALPLTLLPTSLDSATQPSLIEE